MDAPRDIDQLLAHLLDPYADDVPRVKNLLIDEDDRAFVQGILDSVVTGSQGVFIVLHPNERMQYMLLNTNRSGAITLLSKVILRTAQVLENQAPEDEAA